MHHVTCPGGSDGIHLHCTEHAVIEDCLFKTGDDCIAGINVRDLRVRRCLLNTSCNPLQKGTYLGKLTLENVCFTDLSYPSWLEAPAE